MLRVSNLRKLVKPSIPCSATPIALMGTEVGVPVSSGLTVEVPEGTVTATGAGYDFNNGVLKVSTKEGCPLTSEMTFSITGTGPVPALDVRANKFAISKNLICVLAPGVAYVAYTTNIPNWVIQGVPVSVPAGIPYELKCSIADTWVGVWLNGTRIARAEVTPEYLASPYPWTVDLGRFYDSEFYTGHVDSVRLAYGALPDIDVL